MRELGRGGSLVAATIASLRNRTASDEKPRHAKPRSNLIGKNVIGNKIEEKSRDDSSRRASGCSERPLSTASEASERDSASVQSSEEPPPHEMSRPRSLMSDREYLTEPFDEMEERVAGGYVHPAIRSYMYSPMGGDSDSPDETTVKCAAWTEGALGAVRSQSSDSESSSSSEEDSADYEHRGGDADYRTLTPSKGLDNSTRRDDDFKWMSTGEVLDDVGNANSMEARAEEYSSISLDRRKRMTSDRSDRDRKSRSSLSGKPPQHPSSVRASPRPRRTRNDDTPPDLQRRWNSYEHFRWPEGGWWPPMCWCHGPPVPPPCCMHDRTWPSHPSLPPAPSRPYNYKNDAEDRVRRLEADKESLQLQLQVLSEQIAAQSEKMIDLERALTDTRQKLDDAEQQLQKETLQRSSLETQKLELLSKLSEFRLRAAERGMLERSPPPEPAPSSAISTTPLSRPAPPRTPPANYGRQIERNTHAYSSLPRSSVLSSDDRVAFGKQNNTNMNNMVVARGRGRSVPNLAEREETSRGSPSPSLRDARTRLGSGGGGVRIEGDELVRSSMRMTSLTPRRVTTAPQPWQTMDVRNWDCDTSCAWLEALGLDAYCSAARAWLGAATDARGLLAAAPPATIEKELAIKHPMHKKKIVLALADLLGTEHAHDPLLRAAGALDNAWALRWLEDVGAGGAGGVARAAAADASLDGRLLHRLTHSELHHHLHVTHALHALSIKRGIQVLRAHTFAADTMIRRGPERAAGAPASGPGAASPAAVPRAELARWSAHRVMQWLDDIDLSEYAPNLRGAGVHGGLMVLEPRFTGELLAALLNIPAHKTLLRRHLTQRFNDLLGRDVIQEKRTAEQTLGYQPLSSTTKYKVPKKSQFSLKRRKSRDELDVSELVCPLHDDSSGDCANSKSPTMKVKSAEAGVASAVSLLRDDVRAQ